MVFDGAGGNIGRSTDNDWVLPDPQRFVSAHHARVHFRDGLYILEDTSTNGVFINDEERPVAKRGAHVLQNGDILRLGEYQVVAMVESRPLAPRTRPDARPPHQQRRSPQRPPKCRGAGGGRPGGTNRPGRGAEPG